jgi:prevent-host-death family protein
MTTTARRSLMEASVRELKEHLSQYLRAVEAGELVVITRHSRPVARLEPVREEGPEEGVARLAASPSVLWAGGKPAGCRVPLGPGDKTAADLVLEDRR